MEPSDPFDQLTINPRYDDAPFAAAVTARCCLCAGTGAIASRISSQITVLYLAVFARFPSKPRTDTGNTSCTRMFA